jgi:hypothetical protein
MLVSHQNCGSVFEDPIGNQFMISHFACYAQKRKLIKLQSRPVQFEKSDMNHINASTFV